MGQVTIKDVARAARVSYSTVSRALNEKYGVKAETRKAIARVAKEMGYMPNGIARGLVSRRTHSIGLILPDISNPFYPAVAGGIEDAAMERGSGVFLCNTNWDRERELRYIRLLSERRADGIIISPISGEDGYFKDLLEKLPVPVVYVSNAPKGSKRSSVTIDDSYGGLLATQHLIEQGYETIGFIGAKVGSSTVDDRLLGYKTALTQAGLPVDERWIWLEDFTSQSGYQTIRRLIRAGSYPRAIFAENDLLAIGIIQGIKEQGLRIPEDIALVGFDDIPVAALEDVGLSTVVQPKREMGRIATDLLFAEMDAAESDGAPEGTQVVLEPELIIRDTSSNDGKKPPKAEKITIT